MPSTFLLVSFFVCPLLLALLHVLPQAKRVVRWSGIFGGVTLSLLTGWMGVHSLLHPGWAWRWLWMKTESLRLPVVLLGDEKNGMALLLVALVSAAVAIFSGHYMQKDKNLHHYYALLFFFVFSMNSFLLTDQLVQLYVSWEMLGFSSYLMIGFWRGKPKAVAASLKAFLMNRIGDLGFLFAILCAWVGFGSLEISQFPEEIAGPYALGLGGGLLLAAMAKSAQTPLSAWLPDAMAGPTPASALIHAATMVAAGVFLLVRAFPLLTVELLTLCLWVGASTALLGGLYAAVQQDIKKVLAGSTISQLGYMVAAVGLGVPEVALFHLLTHGFYKATLFLAAGRIIDYMHHLKLRAGVFGLNVQDMRLMGSLRKTMPLTFWTYTLAAAGLLGLPLSAGFLSKELLLSVGLHQVGEGNSFAIFLLFLATLLTGFYVLRQWMMVFFGKFRGARFLEAADATAPPAGCPRLYAVSFILLIPFLLGFAFAPNGLSAFSLWWPLALETAHEVGGKYALWASVLSLFLTLLGAGMGYLSTYHLSTNAESKLAPVLGKLRSFFDAGWFALDLSFLKSGLEKSTRALSLISDKLLVRSVLRLSEVLVKNDEKIVDNSVLKIAKANALLGFFGAWYDRVLIDGLVRLTAGGMGKSGGILRNLHQNPVQLYLALALLGLLVLLWGVMLV